MCDTKKTLLNYGYEKGYYNLNEYNWCINGGRIKDYVKMNPLNEKIKRPMVVDFDVEHIKSIHEVFKQFWYK
jgi:hypothetical protein